MYNCNEGKQKLGGKIIYLVSTKIPQVKFSLSQSYSITHHIIIDTYGAPAMGNDTKYKKVI